MSLAGAVIVALGVAWLWVRAADQAQIVELITSVDGIVGSVLAIYGRIVATKKIA